MTPFLSVAVVGLSLLLVVLPGVLVPVDAFSAAPLLRVVPSVVRLQSAAKSSASSVTDEKAEEQAEAPTKRRTTELGLLTFDLDDTLYPIATVVESANKAFVDAMARFGYEGLSPSDIVTTGKQIREEISKVDPVRAKALSHTQIRTLAIRREIEKVILQRKLQACADDWATQVSSLSALVVDNAKKWATNAVSSDVVQAVLSAWEMERHHAAERLLYPEVVNSLKKIKQEHPGVIIGAVTDGRANPRLMTFTLAPYFDFCRSWEDDQAGRTQFFKDLDSVEGNPELTWIYESARHKYAILKEARDVMKSGEAPVTPLVYPATYDDLVWIHVGDDLAFDVGGSAACGAKTILVELPDAMGQTARHRFSPDSKQPGWSTTTETELQARMRMNEAAREKVDEVIHTLEQLPIAINDILHRDD